MSKTDALRYVRCITYILTGLLGVFLWKADVQAQEQLQLQVSVEDYHSILLQWDSDSEESIFGIQRKMKGEQDYTTIAVLSGEAGRVRCHDYAVKLGKEYSYRVLQQRENVIERESNVVTLRMSLPAPDNLKGVIRNQSRVKLTWGKVVGAKNYTVYRSEKVNTGYKKIATVKKNSYTDCDFSRGATYYYKIVANHKKTAYSSAKSSAFCVYGKPIAPDTVGNYVKEKVKLTWKKVKGADLYYVYKKDSKGKYNLVKKTGKLYFKDSEVVYGKCYFYKVVAVKKGAGKNIMGDAGVPCEVLAMELDPKKKMVALTYDDGPGKYTEDILKCLKNNQSKATFFVLGCNINSYKAALKEADRIGCEIGSHTYSHTDLTRLSRADIIKEVEQTDAKISKLIGKKSAILRPPYGAVNETVKKGVGKPIILWSIDTMDWSHRNSKKTIREVMENVKDGDVVLMHDIHESTRDASLILIPQLRRAGYQLVTVSELATYRKYQLKPGEVYHKFPKR